MRGTTRSSAHGGRHAQPKRRAAGSALLPALTSTRPQGRRVAGRDPVAPSAGGAKGSHRAPRRATTTPSSPRPTTATEQVTWVRTVAFSGATGVAALTVGLSVFTDPESASGFDFDGAPQRTAAVTVIESEQTPRPPAARRSAPAEYAVGAVGRAPAERAGDPGEASVGQAPAPVEAAPTGRPAAPAGPSTPAPPQTSEPTATPEPEESPSPGLLEGLTDTLDDATTEVVGMLPGLGG